MKNKPKSATEFSAYYRTVFGVSKAEKELVMPALLFIFLLPRTVIDVFMRTRMGERFYSPFIAALCFFGLYGIGTAYRKVSGIEPGYILFVVAYAIMAVVRYLEIRRAPSVFDFARFSLDSGKSYPFFHRIRIFGKPLSQRSIDIYFEPLFCLLVATLFLLASQHLTGLMIIFCTLCYFMTNYLGAKNGDRFIMEKIDEMIMNEDLLETFLRNEEVSQRGVPFTARKPNTAEMRQDFMDNLREQESDAAAAE